METGLAGKGVLVTGGAGGIGSAVCRAFAAEGARVAVHYHRAADRACALASEIGGVALAADLRLEREAEALVPAAVEALGRLDACVANAGSRRPGGTPIRELPLEEWEWVVAGNLRVAFLTARAYLRHAAAAGSGSLVFTGSTAGMFGEAGHADYAAAKAAIQVGLLLSLKNEAGAGGVRVNAVAPGWTRTEGFEARGIGEEEVAAATSTMALKKLAAPEDVAAQVVALSSDRVSGHVTGQVVVVAGGMEGRVIPP